MQKEHKRLKIGFLTSLSTQNDKRTSWRITNRYMAQALQKYCGDVIPIAPIQLSELLFDPFLKRASKYLLRRNFMLYHTFLVAKRYAKVLSKTLRDSNFDLIFAPAGWTETAFLETKIPVVLLEDASFTLLNSYYPEFSNFLPRFQFEADKLEEVSLNKAQLVLYPSPWAATSAQERYGLDQKKVHVVPFGANVDDLPSREVTLRRKRSGKCKLLFVGMDWKRKGGPIAYETLLKLKELGIQAELTVCGCVPPSSFVHPRMTVIPYLNRKDPEQRRTLEKLYEDADFFFLPTRSESYGMVFCEASSFGLPSIATDTGGVSGAITNGENGFLLSHSAGADEYAKLIQSIYEDESRYNELVQSTRAAFEAKLNWDAWGKMVTQHIYSMLEQNQLV